MIAKVRSQNIKGTPKMPRKSVRHDLLNVIESCSAAGLQEMKWPDYWATLIHQTKKAGWGRYPKVYKGAASAQVLIWDANEWLAVRTWTRLLHGPVVGVCQARFMRAVLLQNKATGDRFILKTTHYLPNRGGRVRFNKIWAKANQRDRDFVEYLAEFGHPVVSTGDYNRSGRVLNPISDDFTNDYAGPDAIDHVVVTQEAGRKQVSRSVATISHRLHLKTDHDGRILALELP